MNAQVIVLPSGGDKREHACSVLRGLSSERPWKIVIAEYKPQRSEQQNRYLWGVCYQTILDQGGETLGGWTAKDLHEFFLGECFGWEVVDAFGKKRQRPLRRSSHMNKQEFSDYIAFIQRKAAEFGVYIPDSDEYLAEAVA